MRLSLKTQKARQRSYEDEWSAYVDLCGAKIAVSYFSAVRRAKKKSEIHTTPRVNRHIERKLEKNDEKIYTPVYKFIYEIFSTPRRRESPSHSFFFKYNGSTRIRKVFKRAQKFKY